MARRRSRKTARKIKPVETTLLFQAPANSGSIIDSAFALSWMNRISLRQGMEYAIQSVEVFGVSNKDITVYVSTISKNWVSCNSWTKAFHHWKEQQDQWEDDVGSQSLKGRYNDFKIYYDVNHQVANTLYPMNTVTALGAGATDPLSGSDWEYSEVVVPNDADHAGATHEYELQMVGPDIGDRKGIIHNYALSRSRPHVSDPNAVGPSTDGGLYQDMVNVGENLEEVGQNVRTHNQQTPYLTAQFSAFEWYPGGANNPLAGSTLRDILTIRSGTGAFASDSTGPFTSLCGLISITNYSETEDVIVKVTYAPGDYKGLMARPMQDVN